MSDRTHSTGLIRGNEDPWVMAAAAAALTFALRRAHRPETTPPSTSTASTAVAPPTASEPAIAAPPPIARTPGWPWVAAYFGGALIVVGLALTVFPLLGGRAAPDLFALLLVALPGALVYGLALLTLRSYRAPGQPAAQ